MNAAGEGSVYFDAMKKSWFAKVPIGRTSSGATAYRKRVARSRRDAERVRRQLLQEREEFRLPTKKNDEPVQFRTFALQHLAGEAGQEIRETTKRGYSYLLERFAYPKFGPMPIQEIKSTELAAFFLELRKTHSASQVNHLRAAMSRVFGAALNHQLVTDNPVKRTKRMRKQEGDKTLTQHPWSLEECRGAMATAVDTEMDLFIHLAILTGARLGEMMALRWSDIDLMARTIRIQRTLVELRGSRSEGGVKGQPTFSPPKTAKSVRTLTFGQQLHDAFLRHQTVQNGVREATGETWIETGQVFTTTTGQPVWVSNFSSRYRKFLKVNSLRHVNIHSMRHGAAQNAIALGVPLFAVSAMLGHASIAITNDIYLREQKNLASAATDGLSEWFGRDETYEVPPVTFDV